MNAVGIDVSKKKSTVTIRQPGDVVLLPPRDYRHTQSSINELIVTIKGLDGETKVCMEHTGRYYEPMASWLTNAGIFVSAVNPKLIRDFGDESLRAPKTDKADSKKIARFALDRWTKLRQYSPMDESRNQLKTMNRQFSFYTDQKTAMKNNLIALLDQTFPGANGFFDSPARSDGSQKWVDFVYTYWHVDCVRGKSLSAFTKHYRSWCKRKGYNFSADKAEEIYRVAADLIAVFPKNENTKMLIRQAVTLLNTTSQMVESLRIQMDQVASTLPEYSVVMAMNGVGPTLGPQLMAEIGDPTRFTHREALTAFAGVDPGADQSGDHNRKSNRTSKKGSPYLRRTLFLIMDGLIQRSPADSPVYAFMDKKRTQGKPYLVYMTAGANKFLRIYYGTVRDYLKQKGLWPVTESDEVNPV
jgi:transposase